MVDRSSRHLVETAHSQSVAGPVPAGSTPTAAAGVRRLVLESWQRSLHLSLDPDKPLAALSLDDDELRDYRSGHPLSLVLPTIHNLLIRHTFDSGLIVAIGDQSGRLLWIDGDRTLRNKAESMLFVEGADWSETAVGTSAPGTALALDRSMQIEGAEHFNRIVHPWSCSAVPVHDPISGAILGVIDITGEADAVEPATLALIEATAAAVEAELRLTRRGEAASVRRHSRTRSLPASERHTRLRVLGLDGGRLEIGDRSLELSLRHAEILTLLAWHRGGLSASALSELLYGSATAVVTVRAEMVRLRRLLRQITPTLVPESRPYRLAVPLELDAQRVLAFLTRGAHKVALAAYAGTLLSSSDAPGIAAIRSEVSGALRAALLTDASADTLLAYAQTDEAALDVEVWRACLQLLPPRSPKRAIVVARIELIERELGVASMP